jgi:hypothetical protein
MESGALHFAIECRNHGHAVILAARTSLFEGLIGPANHFFDAEFAVNLQIAPTEFARMAEKRIDVDRSLEILREMGFQDIPVRLSGWYALQLALDGSQAAGLRLNEGQIRLFNTRVFETTS